jgi:hypothetical protein
MFDQFRLALVARRADYHWVRFRLARGLDNFRGGSITESPRARTFARTSSMPLQLSH